MRNGKIVPMRRGVWFLVTTLFIGQALFWASQGSATAPPSGEHSRITIASYNAENLWDALPNNTPDTWNDYLNSLPSNQRSSLLRDLQYADYAAETSNWYSEKVLWAKAQHFVTTIELMGSPDVVGLQEIESAGNTSAVFEIPFSAQQSLKEKLQELGYQYFLIGPQEKTNPVAVTTAVISKLPAKNLSSVIVNFGNTTSCRDIQVVELSLASGRALLFNSHWKSKNGGFEETREKTAALLRQRIAKERKAHPETDIIALGDFNSSYHESPMQELKTTGDERKMFGKPTPYLYNLWFAVSAEHRWDYSYDGGRQVLSNMLISDSLYDHQGLRYVPHSFTVIGQEGEAARTLLNVDGRPFRWQIAKINHKAVHLGQGYSDHLPLRATFIVYPSIKDEGSAQRKEASSDPSTDDSSLPPPQLLLDEVEHCDPATAKDILSVSDLISTTPTALVGSCVKIDLAAGEESLRLQTWGNYHSVYFTLPTGGKNTLSDATGIKIGLTMTRANDWRPNRDDSRVSLEEVLSPDPKYSAKNLHPHSNECFVRRILQGTGGTVRRFVGKLSYQDGFLAIFAVTRQENDVILEDLPKSKARQCSWDE
jgi:endonuclease/exonuclease/phosphatase family metal-dependent hydrolase